MTKQQPPRRRSLRSLHRSQIHQVSTTRQPHQNASHTRSTSYNNRRLPVKDHNHRIKRLQEQNHSRRGDSFQSAVGQTKRRLEEESEEDRLSRRIDSKLRSRADGRKRSINDNNDEIPKKRICNNDRVRSDDRVSKLRESSLRSSIPRDSKVNDEESSVRVLRGGCKTELNSSEKKGLTPSSKDKPFSDNQYRRLRSRLGPGTSDHSCADSDFSDDSSSHPNHLEGDSDLARISKTSGNVKKRDNFALNFKKDYYCYTCKMTFTTRHLVRTHVCCKESLLEGGKRNKVNGQRRKLQCDGQDYKDVEQETKRNDSNCNNEAVLVTYRKVGSDFFCKECRQTFHTMHKLLLHADKSSGTHTFCSKCDFGPLKTACEWRKHMLSAHQFICRECSKSFKYLVKYFKHRRSRHGNCPIVEGPYTFHGGEPIALNVPLSDGHKGGMQLCTLFAIRSSGIEFTVQYSSDGSLERGDIIHKNERGDFQKPTANTFIAQTDLKNGSILSSELQNGPASSSYAKSDPLEQRKLLEYHIASQVTKRETQFVTCNLCQLSFKGWRGLEHHMAMSHRMLNMAHSSNSSNKLNSKDVYKAPTIDQIVQPSCRECNQVFLSEKSLWRHEQIMHSVTTPYNLSLVQKLGDSPPPKGSCPSMENATSQMWKCIFCYGLFTSASSRAKHMSFVHKSKQEASASESQAMQEKDSLDKEDLQMVTPEEAGQGTFNASMSISQGKTIEYVDNAEESIRNSVDNISLDANAGRKVDVIDLTMEGNNESASHCRIAVKEVKKPSPPDPQFWHVPIGCYLGDMANVHPVIRQELLMYIDRACEEYHVDKIPEIEPWKPGCDWEIYKLSQDIASYLKLAPALKFHPQSFTQCRNYDQKHKFKIPMGHLNPEFADMPLFPSVTDLYNRTFGFKYSAMQVLTAQELQDTGCMASEKKKKRCKRLSREVEKAFDSYTESVIREHSLSYNTDRKRDLKLHEMLVYRVCGILREKLKGRKGFNSLISGMSSKTNWEPRTVSEKLQQQHYLTTGKPTINELLLQKRSVAPAPGPLLPSPSLHNVVQISCAGQAVLVSVDSQGVAKILGYAPSHMQPTQVNSSTRFPLVNQQHVQPLEPHSAVVTNTNYVQLAQANNSQNTSSVMTGVASVINKPVQSATSNVVSTGVKTSGLNLSGNFVTSSIAQTTTHPGGNANSTGKSIVGNSFLSSKLAFNNAGAYKGKRPVLPVSEQGLVSGKSNGSGVVLGVRHSQANSWTAPSTSTTSAVSQANPTGSRLFITRIKRVQIPTSAVSKKAKKKSGKLSKRQRDRLLADWKDVEVSQEVFNQLQLTKKCRPVPLRIPAIAWKTGDRSPILQASKARIYLEDLKKSHKRFRKAKLKQLKSLMASMEKPSKDETKKKYDGWKPQVVTEEDDDNDDIEVC